METLDQIAARWQLATVVRTRGSARTYASRLARFETWCRTQGHCWCPADVETVRAFLEALSEAGVQPQLSMNFVQAINAGHRALGLPPPLPMQRSAAGPPGGKELAVDERYYRAADQMLDPGWRPAHLAALSAPTPPGNGLLDRADRQRCQDRGRARQPRRGDRAHARAHVVGAQHAPGVSSPARELPGVVPRERRHAPARRPECRRPLPGMVRHASAGRTGAGALRPEPGRVRHPLRPLPAGPAEPDRPPACQARPEEPRRQLGPAQAPGSTPHHRGDPRHLRLHRPEGRRDRHAGQGADPAHLRQLLASFGDDLPPGLRLVARRPGNLPADRGCHHRPARVERCGSSRPRPPTRRSSTCRRNTSATARMRRPAP